MTKLLGTMLAGKCRPEGRGTGTGPRSRKVSLTVAMLVSMPLTCASLHAAEEPAAQGDAASDDSGSGGALEEIVVKGRFLQSSSKSATKLDTPVLDTPFSVSAYSD